jgi:phosphoenolpyruvate carboxykinase (GTP)
LLPHADDIDTRGLEVNEETMRALLAVNVEQWKHEMDSIGSYLSGFGDRLPAQLKREHEKVVSALRDA